MKTINDIAMGFRHVIENLALVTSLLNNFFVARTELIGIRFM